MEKLIILKYTQLALVIILTFAWINERTNLLITGVFFIIYILVSFLNRKTKKDTLKTKHLQKEIFLIEYQQKPPKRMIILILFGIIITGFFIFIMSNVKSYDDFIEHLFKWKVEYPYYSHPLFILGFIPLSLDIFGSAFQKTNMYFQFKKGPYLTIQDFTPYMRSTNPKLKFDLEDFEVSANENYPVIHSITNNQKYAFPSLKFTDEKRDQFIKWIAENKY